MAEAKRQHDWNVASTIMALMAEMNRDRKRRRKPFKPDDFNPYAEQKPIVARGTVGRVNSSPWSIFAPGEALFLGGEGGEDEQNWVDVTYHFAARPNEINLTVGNISGVAKRGWDYLWVKHGEEVVGDRVLQVPEAAYVEQVYPEANFNALGIE
tara:strand:- start:6031 stop:6492 length:462 start_codon:yes stop_codon:yes gene_type:complete